MLNPWWCSQKFAKGKGQNEKTKTFKIEKYPQITLQTISDEFR